ncbi:hypothetical protein P9386_18550 [Caldifermentibacillus hisashii]|uniref:hypothetical protein n=1 Tax=Caldifermentibacillus hisashii TaxID=996558 RepID=UPI002E1E50ED|nr:hypothetical protein [Caldifermentibacillus hisashii]
MYILKEKKGRGFSIGMDFWTMMAEWSNELATIQEAHAHKDPGSEKMNQAYVFDQTLILPRSCGSMIVRLLLLSGYTNQAIFLIC